MLVTPATTANDSIIEALKKPAQLYSVCRVITRHYRMPSIIFICIGDHPDTEHPWTNNNARPRGLGSCALGRDRRGSPVRPYSNREGESGPLRQRVREGQSGGRRKDPGPRTGDLWIERDENRRGNGARERTRDCLGISARSHARRACAGLWSPSRPSVPLHR